jgi:hypothetical protein
MTNRPSTARRNVIPYLALLLVLVVGAGGGYALAASNTKTITVCADKKTGILHLHNHGKCKRSQRRVTWNQKGPQGAQGIRGPAGQPGAPAANAWADVSNSGSVVFGQGVSVQHASPGTYQVTITAPACSGGSNAPVVTASSANPPAGQAAGTFPTAWLEAGGSNQQFTVFTGIVVGGAFMPSDLAFDVMDSCT